MKILNVIASLLFFLNCNAQLQDILTQNQWYLYSLTISDQVFIPPVNEEVSSVFLNFEEPLPLFTTHVCNDAFGEVSIDDVNFTFVFVEGLNFTLIECNHPENGDFEIVYFGFYNDNVTETFTCEVIFIDDESGNELISLTINTPNGDNAIYNNWLLSNEEFNQSSFSIYPSPTNTEFYISTNTETNKYAVTIYDVTGKLILSEAINYSGEAINVQSFTSGIYFVSIQDENGNSSIKRLIKK